MPAYIVKNPTRAPRTILLTGASYTLAPGEEKEIDLPDNIAADERTAGMEVTGKNAPKEAPKEAPKAEPKPDEGEDRFEGMEDDELRDFIEDNTGDRPHPRTGRAKLLAAAREI